MKRQSDVVLDPIMVSTAMCELDAVLQAVAPKDVVVTLIGESGSGKEILARRIHELSHRRAGPFIPINSAAIPEQLFESELFGHERGAFTGATERVKGKIEASSGGTLFLDELGEMPLSMQAKLLRFLENRKFMRVGGSTKIRVDTRLVCATLRPLALEVEAGRFRADLYYRIQAIMLDVPPLRHRRADIGPLTNQFLAELSALHSVKAPKLGPSTMAILQDYAWPGNVRELRNVIERVCLLRSGETVRVADLPRALRDPRLPPHPPPSPRNDHTDRNRSRAFAPPTPTPTHTPIESPALVTHGLELFLDQPLDQTVHEILIAVLQAEGGNRSRTARRLGISLRTVQRHLARSPAVKRPPRRG